jgi:hypothetical protein
VRPEIAQQGIGDTPKAFRPRSQAIGTVYTDAQDLGIDPIEALEIALIRWDLTRSDWGPGQREEGQDDVFSAQIVAQPYLTVEVAF